MFVQQVLLPTETTPQLQEVCSVHVNSYLSSGTRSYKLDLCSNSVVLPKQQPIRASQIDSYLLSSDSTLMTPWDFAETYKNSQRRI